MSKLKMQTFTCRPCKHQTTSHAKKLPEQPHQIIIICWSQLPHPLPPSKETRFLVHGPVTRLGSKSTMAESVTVVCGSW